MDDELWSTDRQTERLRTVRAEGTPVWNDSASVQINAGWLDPHDQLATTVLSDARTQTASLDQARRDERAAADHAQVAATRASDTASWLVQLDEAAARARTAAKEAGTSADAADLVTHEALADVAAAAALLRSAG